MNPPGKKSLYNKGATQGWLEYLSENLFPSPEKISNILALLSKNDSHGIIYPLNFHVLPAQVNTWLSNKHRAQQVARRIGLNEIPTSYFDYPAGSMFWAKSDAIRKILEAKFTLNDFEPEAGQNDGTLAHAIERLFAITAKDAGYKVGIIQDAMNPSWSPWRLDNHFARSQKSSEEQINSKDIKLISFDVFDTLVCRPLLDPEMIKEIIAERLGPELGRTFLTYRAKSESNAREKAGRDIGMTEIYEEFRLISKCDAETAAKIRTLEEEIESESLYPREEGVELLKIAAKSGKPVVLISDMFLSPETITNVLEKNKISGWTKLYVSSSIGKRKDSGQLYQHVISDYGLKPNEVLMIGDNERSDWQIPADMGMKTHHILRPTDTARGHIHVAPILEKVETSSNINEHITLGIITQTEFSNIFQNTREPHHVTTPTAFSIGRSILGPLAASFANWLETTNKNNSNAKLFFLAREGQALKLAYDLWTQNKPEAPKSEYLLVSRRCVNVASIENIDDIHRIAKSDYKINRTDLFLQERFGVKPTPERWKQINSATGWHADKIFEIKNGDINHLLELLTEITPDIMDQASTEKPGLLAYLSSLGLIDCRDPILVDVGYSGTIQSALNRLLKREIRGQYMATDSAINNVYPSGASIAKGFFADNHTRSDNSPFILRESFLLEKLLSSDDAQVLYHRLQENGDTSPVFREVSKEEIKSKSTRSEVRKGMVDYIERACRVRDTLAPHFEPSGLVSNLLYEAYVANTPEGEREASKGIVLDDYYCGRGLVS